MKILVCGGRDYTDFSRIQEVLNMRIDTGDTLIHGAANGADSLAAKWAAMRGVKTIAFPANWAKYGRSAGPVRNKLMLDQNPDMVIAFPGGRGTAHMVRIAKDAKIPVVEVQP